VESRTSAMVLAEDEGLVRLCSAGRGDIHSVVELSVLKSMSEPACL
jgi:hypothetical protein